ncbi:ABC-three component system middle component 1 [Undibacterium sp. Ji22W]|uniref:ABC-three component system middle component 1 n=1 Tax=Undibacterium sp. Ji22W TaxID=3413038 RepID=UPI003BF24483
MINNSNQVQDLLNQIVERAGQRFSSDIQSSEVEQVRELASSELKNFGAIFLKRTSNNSAGKRTLLLAVLPDSDALPLAIRWAAEVRSSLAEPETADLFLFLQILNITNDIAAQVEADEQFCRKYVIRPNETIASMLDRSFLAPVYTPPTTADSSTAPIAALSDPLAKAFSATARDHPWFDSENQQVWRSTLLSGEAGADIVEQLVAFSGPNEMTSS